MTREKIIEHLDSIVGTYEILLGNGVNSDILDVDDIEAIKEAISALSAEDSFPDREKGTDGTLVYNADGHFYGVMGGDAIMERIRGKANET